MRHVLGIASGASILAAAFLFTLNGNNVEVIWAIALVLAQLGFIGLYLATKK